MSLLETVYRIDLPRPSKPPSDSKITVDDPLSELIGVHFLDGEQRLLFGTGYADSFDMLQDRLPSSLRPDVVIIEHGDPDHYGAVPQLRDAYTDITVAAPEDDLDQLEQADITVDVPLQHGDTIAGFEAVHVPGHTPGNFSFVDRERGILVVGDSFVSAESEIVAPGNWTGAFGPMKAEFNTRPDEAISSLSRLEEYSFDMALLTHGSDVTTNASAEVDALLNDIATME